MPDDSVLREGGLAASSGESEPHDRTDAAGPRRITRLAAYGVIVRDGRLLLCHISPGSAGAGLWMLPGGGLDFGEPPETGAVREVEEETGLVAEITGPPSIHSDSGVWERPTGDVRFHHVRFVYPMRVTGGDERVEVDGSTDAFEWVPLETVREYPLGDLVVRTFEAIEHAGRGDGAS